MLLRFGLGLFPAAWSPWLPGWQPGSCECAVWGFNCDHPNRHEKNGRLQFHRTYGLYSPGGNACQFIGRYGADGQPRTDLRSAVLAH